MGQSFTGASLRVLRPVPETDEPPPRTEQTWRRHAVAVFLGAQLVAGAVLVAAAHAGAALDALAILAFIAVAASSTVAFVRVRTEAARLAAELGEIASRDGLTGALNRTAFERSFQAWVGSGMRRRIETALLLVDLDQLTRINDQHGHDAGDAALRHLSSIIHDCIRVTDEFGRIEGDAFGLLFPATSGTEATIAAERIRALVAKRSAERGMPFTISVGVTGGHSFSDPWAAAQRALDLAKAAGSNRVVLAETETQAEPELDELPFAA